MGGQRHPCPSEGGGSKSGLLLYFYSTTILVLHFYRLPVQAPPRGLGVTWLRGASRGHHWRRNAAKCAGSQSEPLEGATWGSDPIPSSSSCTDIFCRWWQIRFAFFRFFRILPNLSFSLFRFFNFLRCTNQTETLLHPRTKKMS